MNIQTLNSLTLNYVIGGAGSYGASNTNISINAADELYTFLCRGHYLVRHVEHDMFIEYYRRMDLDRVLAVMKTNPSVITLEESVIISQFGRGVGLFVKNRLIDGIADFLRSQAKK